MKIINIGHARSRTSLLTTYIVNYYNVRDLDESYRYVKQYDYRELSLIKKSENKDDLRLEFYKKKLKKYKDTIFNGESFVIKVFPRVFNATELVQNVNSTVVNLEEYFSLSKYDKIFLTYRNNFVDTLCSLYLGQKYIYNTYDFKKNEYFKNKKLDRKYLHIVEFDPLHQSFICEMLLMNRIKAYLDKVNLPYVYLEYSEVPDYVHHNMICEDKNLIQPIPFDAKINYRDAILNYDELEERVGKYIEDISEAINSIEFV